MKKLTMLGAVLGTAALATAARDQAPQGPPIRFEASVIHALQVADLDASLAWYRDVLGCTLAVDLSEIGWCEVTTPVEGALIGLGLVQEGEERQAGGLLSLGVENVDAAATWLQGKGVRTRPVVVIEGTVKLLELEDLDGNRLMLHQPLRAD